MYMGIGINFFEGKNSSLAKWSPDFNLEIKSPLVLDLGVFLLELCFLT